MTEPTNPPAPPLSIEGREEFEKWATSVEGDGIDGFVADFTRVTPPKNPKWKVADEYCSDEIQAAWLAWQASRASDRERVAVITNRIVAKCEQFWNEPNICDAEVHAILEFIHGEANEINAAPDRRLVLVTQAFVKAAEAAESRATELQREAEGARAVILNESAPGREFGSNESLSHWVHEFGLDREAEGLASAESRVAELQRELEAVVKEVGPYLPGVPPLNTLERAELNELRATESRVSELTGLLKRADRLLHTASLGYPGHQKEFVELAKAIRKDLHLESSQ